MFTSIGVVIVLIVLVCHFVNIKNDKYCDIFSELKYAFIGIGFPILLVCVVVDLLILLLS